jgi:hypothetical protein
MSQALIIIAGWLSSITIAYTVYCIKSNNKEEKIEMMNVRSRVKKIERLNKESKNSLF